MKLRCIIVDDEYLARQRILKLLEDHQDIMVVAECKNGREAIEKIKLKEPDFIFLDIQMPDLDGFSVIEKLDNLPYVIFTTAYESFAIKAFEINAVDYLLKPFDDERIDASIKRMKALKEHEKTAGLKEKLAGLLISLQDENGSETRTFFEIKKNGRILKIRTEDIIYIQSEGNYLELFTEKNKFLYRSTMNAIEAELSDQLFVRIHRSLIVNKVYIGSCFYLKNSEYKVVLKNGTTLLSGRSYKDNIISYLEEAKG
ncbi:LytR/AlgR family response regulator transcription factor [Muriicola sp. Z0-33]|uniref:LytR/AlgR family response regulator transcription factor n=1 Tax=Muriicola sp. Z0-33 TaxID=2816957 RepID=UPI002237E74A|nr:response regulator transcription factor [Muriicola sp. Z0-33]MCW5517325.1 response regulator transcription factor [Muriicola sp. Z0-33]